jgi:hypothetical protein
MNGLLKQLKKTKTHCKAFADDGALITRGNKIKEVMIHYAVPKRGIRGFTSPETRFDLTSGAA